MTLGIVVIVSAGSEWRSVVRLFPDAAVECSPFGDWFIAAIETDGSAVPLVFLHGGWGKTAAAASAQWAIDRWRPTLVVNLGTCGGFADPSTALPAAGRGAIVLAARTVIYDIVELMSDADAAIAHYATDIDLGWLDRCAIDAAYPGCIRGTLASADRDLLQADVSLLRQRYNAVAADWESGAIAWVAARNDVRCLILRGVSDLVGAAGGEAYSNLALFAARAEAMMRHLVGGLPIWIGGALAGARNTAREEGHAG